MKVTFMKDLYYPMECALMLARETNREFGLELEEGSCPVSCDFFLRRFLKGRSPDAAYLSLSQSLASIQELSRWVWENLSASMEKRKKYFSWQQGVEPIGMIVVYEEMRQGPLENSYPQLALLLTSVLTQDPALGIEEHPEKLPSDEHSLCRFLTELSIEPALRLFLIDYVCHRKKYREEVLDILREAEMLFKKKEKLVGVVIRSPGSGLFCIPIPILSLQFRLERKTIRVGMSMPENVFSFAILHNPFPLFFARYQVIILK